jgi:hypothetical protein
VTQRRVIDIALINTVVTVTVTMQVMHVQVQLEVERIVALNM